jgi:glycosyltransferase involved in cell wall biosynthesis
MNKKIPLISIITVTMNDAVGLEKTINSILCQKYHNYEFIIVDGKSNDNSNFVIDHHREQIDKVVSESDQGIYHAMNKGIDLADGEWLIFMNAGDVFASETILADIEAELDENVDVLYSNWKYFDHEGEVRASKEKLNVRHQSLIYRKSLHDTYGNYLVGKKVSISDYIFFLSVQHLNWKFFPSPISICDHDGVSANPSHFYQRILSEGIYGKRSNLNCACILVLYPLYRLMKVTFKGMFKL